MKNFLLKFIKQKNINLNTNLKFENLKKKYEIKKIFNIFSNDLNNCQIRFIGGCVRKALSNENIDDIDLAVDLTPEEVKLILKNIIRVYFVRSPKNRKKEKTKQK